MNHTDCITKINTLLAPYNTELQPIFSFTGDAPQRIAVCTSKIDAKKRGQPKMLFATFCPFCGVKL